MVMREAHEQSVRHEAKQRERLRSRPLDAARCKLAARFQFMPLLALLRSKQFNNGFAGSVNKYSEGKMKSGSEMKFSRLERELANARRRISDGLEIKGWESGEFESGKDKPDFRNRA
jgi:hypothetical protein